MLDTVFGGIPGEFATRIPEGILEGIFGEIPERIPGRIPEQSLNNL